MTVQSYGAGKPVSWRENRSVRTAGLVLYRAGSELAGKGAFFLVTIVAARRLSNEAFGLFALGTTFGWIAAVATDFGMQLHLAREVAQQPARAALLLRQWLRVRLWTALAAVAAVAAALPLSGASRSYALPLALFTVVYVISGLIEFLHYFYRGLSRTDLESSLTLMQRLGTLVLGLGVLWWKPDVVWLALAMLIPVGLTFAYSLRRAVALADEAAGTTTGERAGAASWASVLPIGAGIVLSALYFRVDVFLLDAWAGTRTVGLYNAVFRLVEALRLLPAAVLAVALPSLCRATTHRPVILLSLTLTLTALAVAGILAWRADGLVPLIYGGRFAEAVPAFRVLLFGFPLMTLNAVLTHQLVGWHRQRAYAVICGAALIFNIALNTELIPTLGLLGAAWTTVATEALLTVGCVVALARVTHGVADGTADSARLEALPAVLR
jgi:O-antigen/teichoic acid export membrane protein